MHPVNSQLQHALRATRGRTEQTVFLQKQTDLGDTVLFYRGSQILLGRGKQFCEKLHWDTATRERKRCVACNFARRLHWAQEQVGLWAWCPDQSDFPSKQASCGIDWQPPWTNSNLSIIKPYSGAIKPRLCLCIIRLYRNNSVVINY